MECTYTGLAKLSKKLYLYWWTAEMSAGLGKANTF